jgi:hypothetical protein
MMVLCSVQSYAGEYIRLLPVACVCRLGRAGVIETVSHLFGEKSYESINKCLTGRVLFYVLLW